MTVEPLILEGEIHNHADYPHTRWFIGNVDLDKILDELSFQSVRITIEPPIPEVRSCETCGLPWGHSCMDVVVDLDGNCSDWVPK